MEAGFGINLEGFLIKGNLSLSPAELPVIQGDGSLEGSGTLYFNRLQEYDVGGGVTIQGIVIQNQQVYIPYTGPSDHPTSASFIIDGGVTINNITNSVSITSGGALTVKGGAAFKKNVHFGGIVDLNNNKIVNVPWPVNGLDGVNKDYVDSVADRLSGNFTTGQVIIAASNGDAIRGYDSFTFNGNELRIDTPVYITNAQPSINLSTGSLVINGGITANANSIIDGTLNMYNNYINNVLDPINPSDAATKQYVDSKTYGNLLGSFGNTQIIIGTTDQNTLISYNSFTYDGTNLILGTSANLIISNTNNSNGLTSGAPVIFNGGVNIYKDVYIGGELDVNLKNIRNVQDPVLPYDAVNKRYVDDLFNNVTIGNIYLQNNTLTPTDIDDFIYPVDIEAFVTYVYVHNDYDKCCVYTLKGINRNGNWYLWKQYSGEPTNITFYINSLISGEGQIQYTNTNISGLSSIRYYSQTLITDLPTPENNQINKTLQYTNTFIDIPELQFSSNNLDANKLYISVSSLTDDRYGLYIIDCSLKGSNWISNISSIGNIQNIRFTINTSGPDALVQYTNTNISTDYILRCQQLQILNTMTSYTLFANTNVPTYVSESDFAFSYYQNSFNLTIYVEAPSQTTSALYTIEGFYCDGSWHATIRYSGDILNVQFSLYTNNNIAYLKYINPNNFDLIVKVLTLDPSLDVGFRPLPVINGGTGMSYLTPYTVLRGNGENPIIGTIDFIYKDYTLILGSSSSIYINNTSPAINLTTGGTFTTLGGVSINKNVIIGEQLTVKDVDITPSTGDITAERVFYALNNQNIPSDITDFIFNSNVKSFTGVACITVTTNSNIYDMLYELKGLQKLSGWIMSYNLSLGDILSFTFSITSTGQIQYTSPNLAGWIQTVIHFRALTTTI
jgi:hypothetical protein